VTGVATGVTQERQVCRGRISSMLARRLFLAFAACGLAVVPATAQAVDPSAVVAEAAERYAELSSLCADFEQDLYTAVLDRSRTSAGRLCQATPNLFAMEFSDPHGDRIVVDGADAWVWYRSINPETVLRVPLDPASGGFDFYREFLHEPLSKYRIAGGSTEEVDDVVTVRVDLVPLEPREYVGALVWIDPATDLIRRIAIEDANGSVRTVTLTNIELEPAIAPQTFVFEVPAGVTVTGPRGGER